MTELVTRRKVFGLTIQSTSTGGPLFSPAPAPFAPPSSPAAAPLSLLSSVLFEGVPNRPSATETPQISSPPSFRFGRNDSLKVFQSMGWSFLLELLPKLVSNDMPESLRWRV